MLLFGISKQFLTANITLTTPFFCIFWYAFCISLIFVTLHYIHCLFFTNNHSTANGLRAQHGVLWPIYSLGRPAARARCASPWQCLHQPLPGVHALCGFGEVHWGGLHGPGVHSCSESRKWRCVACPLRDVSPLRSAPACPACGPGAICSAEAVWSRSWVLHSASLAGLTCRSSHITKIHHIRHPETWLLRKSNYQCF